MRGDTIALAVFGAAVLLFTAWTRRTRDRGTSPGRCRRRRPRADRPGRWRRSTGRRRSGHVGHAVAALEGSEPHAAGVAREVEATPPALEGLVEACRWMLS